MLKSAKLKGVKDPHVKDIEMGGRGREGDALSAFSAMLTYVRDIKMQQLRRTARYTQWVYSNLSDFLVQKKNR